MGARVDVMELGPRQPGAGADRCRHRVRGGAAVLLEADPSRWHWSAAYIGIPFLDLGRTRAGVDCWGLVCVVYQDQFGVLLPSYTARYANCKDHAEVARLVLAEESSSPEWTDIPMGSEQEGDVVIFNVQGDPSHCGIVLNPPFFLHCDELCDTVRDSYSRAGWARRVVKFKRHRALMEGSNHGTVR
jgi:cell wall-associated NlpC family hydrolase